MLKENQLKVIQVPIKELKPSEYNPRRWSADAIKQLKDSITRFGLVDPIIANSAPGREQVVIGGHFRLKVAKELGFKDVPVVYLNLSDISREKELNIRLNKNLGEFDFDMLKSFGEEFLADLGFSSEDLDRIFEIEDTPGIFDLEKELRKLDIKNIEIQKGDLWALGESRMYCGDSTIEDNMLGLMGDEKADMVLTDPPYILDYLKGKKKHGQATEGFGYKRDRKYLETDFLPDDFTEKWMANVHKVQKDDFHIIVYENWKNLRTIWNEMERYWKVKNMIVWHLPNRVQNFSSKYKFFNKHDIAMVGTNKDLEFNFEKENKELQNEYETALYGISGKPAWESYEKGKKYCPTDFIEFKAADEKSSGQGIIFGTKPTEILIPYIKVLTQRDDLILEPFGGSGSTLIAATKMKRRCYLMEKSPIYAEVIRKRWENLTDQKAKLISRKKVRNDKQK